MIRLARSMSCASSMPITFWPITAETTVKISVRATEFQKSASVKASTKLSKPTKLVSEAPSPRMALSVKARYSE